MIYRNKAISEKLGWGDTVATRYWRLPTWLWALGEPRRLEWLDLNREAPAASSESLD